MPDTVRYVALQTAIFVRTIEKGVVVNVAKEGKEKTRKYFPVPQLTLATSVRIRVRGGGMEEWGGLKVIYVGRNVEVDSARVSQIKAWANSVS